MSIMKVTLLGLETYLHDYDKSLFDELTFPNGINKEDTINNILLEAGEFEPLYAEPYFLRSAISLWGRKHYRTFKKWIDALNIEYAPLENYDRDESWWDHSEKDSDNTRTLDHQDKRTLDTQDKRTLDTQEKRTLDTQDKRTLDTESKLTLDTENKRTLDTQDKETRDTSDENVFDKTTTTENEVSAFDSSSYQAADKTTVDEDGTVTVNGTGTDTFDHTGTDTLNNSGTETTDNTGTDTLDHTGTDTLDNTGTDTLDHSGTDTVDYSGTIKDEGGEEVSSSHGGRIHGNIGVTTSQQMLQAELDISRWNIIQQITDLFVTEFCIMVYD